MKTFLALWVIWQLVIIGVSGVSIHNQIVDKTYECNRPTTKIPEIRGAILPLALFVPEDKELINYCHY